MGLRSLMLDLAGTAPAYCDPEPVTNYPGFLASMSKDIRKVVLGLRACHQPSPLVILERGGAAQGRPRAITITGRAWCSTQLVIAVPLEIFRKAPSLGGSSVALTNIGGIAYNFRKISSGGLFTSPPGLGGPISHWLLAMWCVQRRDGRCWRSSLLIHTLREGGLLPLHS